MKTSFLTIITAAVLVAGLANNSKAATVKNDDSNYTVLTDVKSVNRIEVRGNVEVYVSDAATDEVKVYNKYYNESALVQNTNGVLRITSYKAEKMIVWVKANDLRSIAAYDNAEVKSFGKLSKIDMDVELHDNSVAKLDVDAFSANLIVKDHAKADLSGTTEQYNLKRDAWATVNNSDFKAARTIKNEVTFASEDLAGI